MFEENENLVTEEVTENVEEQATEELVEETVEEEVIETPKTYTEEEMNARLDELLAKKLARKENKIRKEYEKKYGRLENVLKAGTGSDSVEEITDTFTDFYTKRGVQIPTTPQYSDRDMEYLAERDANEIIALGIDDITEELNRLTDIGFDNMSKADKVMFSKLKQEADRIINEKELKALGITSLPDDFKEVTDKLNPNLSLKEKYEMYAKLNPKKKVEPIGSMKTVQMPKVKDTYTEEELSRLTLDELNDPKVWEAVRRSMTGQG